MKLPAYRNKFGSLPVRMVQRAMRWIKRCSFRMIRSIPYFRFIKAYEGKQGPITLSTWFMQKVVGINREAYWGTHFTSRVSQPRHVVVGINTNPGIEPGCYIQGIGHVFFGDYVEVAANIAIISANHDPLNLDEHVHGEVRIGSYSWLGANSVILPNVHLGDFTIVGAGSVVTKSFPEGHCIIAGNPARKIRDLDPAACIRREQPAPFIGYMPANEFAQFRKDWLWI